MNNLISQDVEVDLFPIEVPGHTSASEKSPPVISSSPDVSDDEEKMLDTQETPVNAMPLLCTDSEASIGHYRTCGIYRYIKH